MNIIKWQKHKQIERFGVLFLLFAGVFVAVCVLCIMHQYNANDEQQAKQAIYTSSFQTSYSKVSGTVEGVFSNESHNKCVVLMKLTSTDSISLDASAYKVYLAVASQDGSKQYSLTDNVSGNLYTYGNTGYFAVYLTGEKSFDLKHLYLKIQNTKPLGVTSKSKSNVGVDSWSVIFNPGASGTSKSSALENDTFDPSAFYKSTIANATIKTAKSTAESDLATLKTNLATVDEWKNRVSDANVDITDALPVDIRDDKVVNADGKLTLNTTSTGVDIDWRGGNVETGYLASQGITSVSDLDTYLALKSTVKSSTSTLSTSSQVWRTKAGEVIDTNGSSQSTITSNQVSAIKGLVDAINTYRTNKTKYMNTDMLTFVQAEFDYKQICESTKVNENVVERP